MRDNTIYSMFNSLSKEVETFKQKDNDIMLMRLQLDGMIRMVRFLFPIGWLFTYCFKKSIAVYQKQMEDGIKAKKEAMEQIKKEREELYKLELPCSCGSLKKYKNCCMSKPHAQPNPKAENQCI